jgi:hypothetical protein
MRRYVLAAGYAASEVGALMAVVSVIGLATGATSWMSIRIILPLVGLGIWLWWRRSPVAAVLMLALVGFEYWQLAVSRPDSSWVRTFYPILFLVALVAHGKKAREPVATVAQPPAVGFPHAESGLPQPPRRPDVEFRDRGQRFDP